MSAWDHFWPRFNEMLMVSLDFFIQLMIWWGSSFNTLGKCCYSSFEIKGNGVWWIKVELYSSKQTIQRVPLTFSRQGKRSWSSHLKLPNICQNTKRKPKITLFAPSPYQNALTMKSIILFHRLWLLLLNSFVKIDC